MGFFYGKFSHLLETMRRKGKPWSRLKNHIGSEIMKKLLLVSGILLSSSITLASNHSSCSSFKSESLNSFKITKSKKEKNVLYFATKINAESCEFEADVSISPYWVMGHKTDRGTPTCEDITNSEISNFLGYSSRSQMKNEIARYIDENTVEVKIPKLVELGKEFDGKPEIDDVLTLKAEKSSSGQCEIKSYSVVNDRDVQFDQLHISISWFSISNVKLMLSGNKIF